MYFGFLLEVVSGYRWMACFARRECRFTRPLEAHGETLATEVARDVFVDVVHVGTDASSLCCGGSRGVLGLARAWCRDARSGQRSKTPHHFEGLGELSPSD